MRSLTLKGELCEQLAGNSAKRGKHESHAQLPRLGLMPAIELMLDVRVVKKDPPELAVSKMFVAAVESTPAGAAML